MSVSGLQRFVLGIVLVSPVAGPLPGQEARTDAAGDLLPPGTVARLGTVRFRHPWNRAVAFSPDGKTLASLAEHGSSALRFWEPATGKLLGEIRASDATFRAFAFTPGGKQVVAVGALLDADGQGTAGAVRFWDVARRKELRTWKLDEKTQPSALALSPDGKVLFTNSGELGESDGSVRVWEVETGAELLSYKPNEQGTRVLAVSPDGKTLAAGGQEAALALWEWEAGGEPRKIKLGDRGVQALAFSPDGKTVAAALDYGVGVGLYDVATGRLRRTIKEHASTRMAPAVAFSPDGKLLATADSGNRVGDSYGGVLLWDSQTGKLVRHLKTFGVGVGRVVFSPDGRRVAAQTRNGLRLWEVGTGREVAANDAAHQGEIASVVAAGGLVATSAFDKTVRLWDAATGRQQHVLRHDGAVRFVALSPDGSRLVSSSLDDAVRVWDTATGKVIYRLPGHGWLGTTLGPVGFTPDGKRFLSFGDDFFLRVTDAATAKALLEHKIRPTGIEVPDEDVGPHDRDRYLNVASMSCLSPDGKALVLHTNKGLHLFDVTTGRERLLEIDQEGYVGYRAVSPDGRRLLTSAQAPMVETRLPDGRTRYSPAQAHPVCLWDLSSGKRVWRFGLPEGGHGPVAFSADGKRCALAAHKPLSRILVWDTATGKEVAQVPRLPGTVWALAFSPDGKRLFTGMEDTTTLIWDLK